MATTRRIAVVCCWLVGCGSGDETATDAAEPQADGAPLAADASPVDAPGADAPPPDAEIPDATPPADATRELVGVAVEPPVIFLPFSPYPLTAMALYSDGFSRDATAEAEWSSSDTMVATVSADGVAQARCGGMALISAKYMDATGSTMATAIYDGVIEIDILPPFPDVLPLGHHRQFSALLTYPDGSTLTVFGNPALTWSSSNEVVATISKDGLAYGVGPGATNIGLRLDAPAADGSELVCYVLMATPVPMDVCACLPVLLEIEPADPTVAAGAMLALRAMATWSDGVISDETEYASWSSDAPEVAMVSDTPGSRGLVTGVSAGTATITATSIDSPLLTTTATITVTGP